MPATSQATLDKVAPGRCSANAKSQGTAPVTPSTTLSATPAGVTVVAPKRLVDTRETATWSAAESSLTVTLDGVVPADATAVLVNLTATDPCAAGFLTAYGCKQALPATSNVNVAATGSRATMAVVPVNGEDLCVYTQEPRRHRGRPVRVRVAVGDRAAGAGHAGPPGGHPLGQRRRHGQGKLTPQVP